MRVGVCTRGQHVSLQEDIRPCLRMGMQGGRLGWLNLKVQGGWGLCVGSNRGVHADVGDRHDPEVH